MKMKTLLISMLAALSFGALAADPVPTAPPEAPKVEVEAEAPKATETEEKGLFATAVDYVKSAAATASEFISSDDDEDGATAEETKVEGADAAAVPGDHAEDSAAK